MHGQLLCICLNILLFPILQDFRDTWHLMNNISSRLSPIQWRRCHMGTVSCKFLSVHMTHGYLPDKQQSVLCSGLCCHPKQSLFSYLDWHGMHWLVIWLFLESVTVKWYNFVKWLQMIAFSCPFQVDVVPQICGCGRRLEYRPKELRQLIHHKAKVGLNEHLWIASVSDSEFSVPKPKLPFWAARVDSESDTKFSCPSACPCNSTPCCNPQNPLLLSGSVLCNPGQMWE